VYDARLSLCIIAAAVSVRSPFPFRVIQLLGSPSVKLELTLLRFLPFPFLFSVFPRAMPCVYWFTRLGWLTYLYSLFSLVTIERESLFSPSAFVHIRVNAHVFFFFSFPDL